MFRLRQHLNKLINRLLSFGIIQNGTRNYNKVARTTGLIGLTSITSIYIWQNYRHYIPIPPQLKNVFAVPVNDQPKEHYNFIVNVTRKCAPSVVAIEVKNSKRLTENGEPMLTSTGSGFVVKSNGWIMTNAHVIMNKPNAIVNVITTTGKIYTATIHDIDLKLDLALLKISCYNLPALPLGKSKDVLTGEWVVALGSPLSLKHTITAGVVSSVSREAKDLGFSNNSIKFIQTDAAITFGHSGGPLVNLDGEVIGVNNLRITAGIAFAIPIDHVKEFLLRSKMHANENARVQESMKQPRFGITTLALSDASVQDMLKEEDIILPDSTKGVLVWNIVKNSLADKAGLRPGDIIVKINNIEVSSIAEFYNILTANEKKVFTFTVYRKGVSDAIILKVKDS